MVEFRQFRNGMLRIIPNTKCRVGTQQDGPSSGSVPKGCNTRVRFVFTNYSGPFEKMNPRACVVFKVVSCGKFDVISSSALFRVGRMHYFHLASRF